MLTYLMTNGSLVLHYDGKTKTIAQGDDRFEKVVALIRENKLEEIPEVVETERYFAKQGLDLKDGLLHVGGEAMPVELSDRILAYKETNIPFDSLLKFWEKLKLNPSFNSRKQLFKFLENKGHSITQDGNFVGYRGVTEDFKDRHTKTFDNKPGSMLEMPRNLVDDNPDNTCSYGFHVGGYEYAKDFANGGKLVLVEVDPQDVVAVPNDYNGQKMRVCKFKVLEEVTDMVTAPVYGELYEEESEEENFDESDVEQVPGFDDEDVDAVLSYYSEFKDSYDGDSLITRIEEEVDLNFGDVAEILNAKGITP